MSTFKSPVGPQPSKVYWRRRLVVGLGILAVIIVIILIVARPGSSKPTAAHTPTGTHSSAAASVAGAVKTCKPTDVTVTPVTDATTYAAGVNPMLSLKITNTGATACTFKVGSDVQVYTITSGTETIWKSSDCQKDPVAATKTLEPGVALTSTPFAWDRIRSSATTCLATNPPQVTAGGASYHLGVAVDGVKSAKTVQFILK
jgi:hypothetical protein